MFNFNKFLKTALVAGLMVTMAPDAKPMNKSTKFDEKELSKFILAQDYDAATAYAEKHLAGPQSDVAFDAIQKLRFDHCDQYCLYMDIYNFSDRKRKGVNVGSGEIVYVLKSMIFQMLLLPGEIACCLARGDDPQALMDLFTEFQFVYNHWFTKYFCQDKEMFDKQSLYKYITVLQGAVGETATADESFAAPEDAEEDDEKAPKSFKEMWDRKKIAPPFPVWAFYCKKLADGYLMGRTYRMGFGTPKPQERNACENGETVRLHARIRKECWNESCLAARGCETWEAFWALKLADLIPKQLGKLVKGFKKDVARDGVDGITDGVSGMALGSEKKGPAKAATDAGLGRSAPQKAAEPKPKAALGKPSGDGTEDGKTPEKQELKKADSADSNGTDAVTNGGTNGVVGDAVVKDEKAAATTNAAS